MSDDLDRKYEAYTTIGQMTADEFRRLIDGKRLPLSRLVDQIPVFEDQRVVRGDGPLRQGLVSDAMVLRQMARSDAKARELFQSDDISPCGDDISLPEVFDVTYLDAEFAPFDDRLEGHYMRHIPEKPTVGSVLRQFGEIALTLGRIARAWVAGKP